MGTSWDTFPLRSVQPMKTELSVGKVCKEQNHSHLLLFIYFGHTAWLAGSQFPSQGLNPGPWQWKQSSNLTGLPGNSLNRLFKSKIHSK